MNTDHLDDPFRDDSIKEDEFSLKTDMVKSEDFQDAPLKRNAPSVDEEADEGDEAPSKKLASFSLPFRCLIPAGHVGLVIGKAGSTLKEIMWDTQAFVNIARDFNLGNGVQDKVLSITGAGSAKQEAIRMVIRKIRYIERHTDEDIELFVVLIPAAGRRVISDDVISEIRTDTGVDSIVLHESYTNPPVCPVLVKGTVNSTTEACGHIYRCLHQAVQRGDLTEDDFEIEGLLSGRENRKPPPAPTGYVPSHQRGDDQMSHGYHGGSQRLMGTFDTSGAMPAIVAQIPAGSSHPLAVPDYFNSPPFDVPWQRGGAFPVEGFIPTFPRVDQLGIQTNFMLRLAVPPEISDWIVGNRATNIRFLTGTSGANVRFDRDLQRQPIQPEERQVRILGGVLAKRIACRMVLDQICEAVPGFAGHPLRMVITANQARNVIRCKEYIEQKACVRLRFGANNLPNPDAFGHTEKLILIDGDDYETKLGGLLLLHWACEQLECPELKNVGAPPVPPSWAFVRRDAYLFAKSASGGSGVNQNLNMNQQQGIMGSSSPLMSGSSTLPYQQYNNSLTSNVMLGNPSFQNQQTSSLGQTGDLHQQSGPPRSVAPYLLNSSNNNTLSNNPTPPVIDYTAEFQHSSAPHRHYQQQQQQQTSISSLPAPPLHQSPSMTPYITGSPSHNLTGVNTVANKPNCSPAALHLAELFDCTQLPPTLVPPHAPVRTSRVIHIPLDSSIVSRLTQGGMNSLLASIVDSTQCFVNVGKRQENSNVRIVEISGEDHINMSFAVLAILGHASTWADLNSNSAANSAVNNQQQTSNFTNSNVNMNPENTNLNNSGQITGAAHPPPALLM